MQNMLKRPIRILGILIIFIFSNCDNPNSSKNSVNSPIQNKYQSRENDSSEKNAVSFAKMFLKEYLNAESWYSKNNNLYSDYTTSEFPSSVLFLAETGRWYITFNNGLPGCSICIELNSDFSMGTATNSTSKIIKRNNDLSHDKNLPPLFKLDEFERFSKEYFKVNFNE